MTIPHGKSTYVSIDGTDISSYVKNANLDRGADEHDTTTFGVDDKSYQGGLREGSFSLDGVFDDGDTDTPRIVIGEDAIGITVAVEYRPGGTGSGNPERTFTAVITSYNESTPHDDIVAWDAELRVSGAVDSTDQT